MYVCLSVSLKLNDPISDTATVPTTPTFTSYRTHFCINFSHVEKHVDT